MFEIFLSDTAKEQLDKLKADNGLRKRYAAVKKTIMLLSTDLRYKSLNTHELTSLKGPSGEKIFEAYEQQSTPAAYRVFWYYSSLKSQITIVAITPHL